MVVRQCSMCKDILPDINEYFYRRSNGNSSSNICRICHSVKMKLWRIKNIKRIKAQRKQYWSLDISTYKQRIQVNKSKYGLNEQQCRDLMDKQKGCCPLCGKSLLTPNSKRSYDVDHCHFTSKVRGLLCAKCNMRLGDYEMIINNPVILNKHNEYLGENNVCSS